MDKITAMQVRHAHGNLQSSRHHCLDVWRCPSLLALQEAALQNGILHVKIAPQLSLSPACAGTDFLSREQTPLP